MVQDIIDGISGFASGVGGTILDLILSFIGTICSIVLFPINAIISFFFPNFSTLIESVSTGITRLATAPIGYFAYHIPPLTRSVLLVYLAIMVAYYSFIWTYRGIILIPTVIKKIKFW